MSPNSKTDHSLVVGVVAHRLIFLVMMMIRDVSSVAAVLLIIVSPYE
jgi:hypothetical protein